MNHDASNLPLGKSTLGLKVESHLNLEPYTVELTRPAFLNCVSTLEVLADCRDDPAASCALRKASQTAPEVRTFCCISYPL